MRNVEGKKKNEESERERGRGISELNQLQHRLLLWGYTHQVQLNADLIPTVLITECLLFFP